MMIHHNKLFDNKNDHAGGDGEEEEEEGWAGGCWWRWVCCWQHLLWEALRLLTLCIALPRLA